MQQDYSHEEGIGESGGDDNGWGAVEKIMERIVVTGEGNEDEWKM